MRNIHYNPALSINENAKKNSVSESMIRHYIKVNSIDRRYEAKVAIVEEGRKYLKKHPTATLTEVSNKTHHSINTIRKYWENITTEKGLSDFDKKKSKKRLLRQYNNFYATHPSLAEDLLRVESFADDILEPCCGKGMISQVLEGKGYNVDSYDIVDRGYGKVANFFELDVMPGKYDIVTNPPFDSCFISGVKRCIELCKRKVALLLPLSYLAGQERYQSLYETGSLARIYVYINRVQMAKNAQFELYAKGSQTKEYAWFIFDKEYQGEPLLRWLYNEVKNPDSF